MLRRAFDLGVTHFDLANNYGPPPGSAEETFGRIFKKDFLPYRDELIISTNGHMWLDRTANEMRKYLIASLDRIEAHGLDYVDIFCSHLDRIPAEETMERWFAVRSGRALYAAFLPLTRHVYSKPASADGHPRPSTSPCINVQPLIEGELLKAGRDCCQVDILREFRKTPGQESRTAS
jgi:L-glyceraldehyde 3-phosphate reductase